MKNKVVSVTFAFAFAIFLNACIGSEKDDETNVIILNKKSVEEQKKPNDNGYCPLLPYPFDPRIPREESSIPMDSIRDVLEESDSFQKVIDDWQEEVQRLRSDPTRTATVTFSKRQTVINLSPVFVDVILDLVRLENNKKNDTLYINAVSGKNGSYGQVRGMTRCPVSLDIALNYIVDENIKVVVFEKNQIFQVKRQETLTTEEHDEKNQ